MGCLELQFLLPEHETGENSYRLTLHRFVTKDLKKKIEAKHLTQIFVPAFSPRFSFSYYYSFDSQKSSICQAISWLKLSQLQFLFVDTKNWQMGYGEKKQMKIFTIFEIS